MNANRILEAIGRVFRIGQLRALYIWIFVVDGTYDQCLHSRAARMFVGQMAGSLSLVKDHEDILLFIDNADEHYKLR